MRRHILCILFCLLAVACSKTEFSDHLGNQGNFSDYRGQWLVINYWAVWCKPCVTEIPELNHFAQSQADTVKLFGVDYDQAQGQALDQAIKKLGIEFAVLNQDPASTLGYTRPTVLPTTLIFNPQGELHRQLKGPQTLQSLQQAISAKPETLSAN